MNSYIKREKGVTLISLIITIIVLTIIAGIVVYKAGDFTNTSRFNKMKADIELLHDKILAYNQKYEELPIEGGALNLEFVTGLIGTGENEEDQRGDNDSDIYYKIDVTKLENVTLNYGKGADGEDDYYIVNSTTFNVYYAKGIQLEGTIYHVGEEYIGSIFPSGEMVSLVKSGKIKIGDYVNYTPDSVTLSSSMEIAQDCATYLEYPLARFDDGNLGQETFQYRVLGFTDDEKSVVLIADGVVEKTLWAQSDLISGTGGLDGPNNYNNWVYLSDEYCRVLYSREGVGTARNTKIEDIEKYVKPGVLTFVDNSNANVQEAINTFRTGVHEVPSIWVRESNTSFNNSVAQEPLGRSEMTRADLCLGTSASTSGVFTSERAYASKRFTSANASNDWINPVYQQLFYGKTPYGYVMSSRTSFYSKSMFCYDINFRSICSTFRWF